MSMLLLAIPFVFAAVAMGYRAYQVPRLRVQGVLAQIESDYSFNHGVTSATVDPARKSIVAAIGTRAMARLGAAQLAEERKLLASAGMHRVSAEQLTGYRVVAAVAVPLTMLQLAAASGPAVAALMIGLGAVIGWKLPRMYVARRATARLTQIDRSMPELVDLLVVGVESGIGFNGAINAAASRVRGPLAEELRLMLQEQGLGASLTEALERTLERADSTSLRIFVRTITQGERLGMPVANVLRNLADEMRKRQRADAEERANKAPVKILFPLVFLIFPSIFIILLTPAAITIVGGLGSGTF
jgi:tight adherence protein C